MTGMDKKSKKPLRIKIISMGNAEVGKVRVILLLMLFVCAAFSISSYGYGRGTCEFRDVYTNPSVCYYVYVCLV